MLRRVLAVAAAAAFLWPGVVAAQEEGDAETPPVLMISSWKCDIGQMGQIASDWAEKGVKAARAVVDGGDGWMSAGVYYHAWADDWNVNYWAVGPDIASLIAGQEASNAKYAEMYPDDDSGPWDACSEHKDAFYTLMPATEGPEDDGDDAGRTLVISSWKCTDVPAAVEAYNSSYRAKLQAVVDAGQYAGAGMFVHSWGDPWNVNFYSFAADIPTFIEGNDAYFASLGEDAPDLTESCHAHKDGIYTSGPSTDDGE